MSTASRAESAPDKPTDVPKRSWLQTLRRTIKEVQADNLTDWAAALTYYAILALAALVALLGLVGDPATTTRTLLDIVREIAPQQVEQPIADLTAKRSAAGIALIVSLALALWSASGYVGALMRADNAMYEVDEGRPFWKLRRCRCS